MDTALTAVDIETTGLSPLTCSVVSIAVCSDGEFTVWESKNEQRLLNDFAYWLTSRPAGTLITWNGSGFDWPFLATRAAVTESKLSPLLQMTESPTRMPAYGPIEGHYGGYLVEVAGWRHVDAMLPWREISNAEGERHALKAVARRNGIEVVEVDRTKIVELTKAELAAYNVSDVDATLQLAVMLGDELYEWLDDLELALPL